MPRETPPELYHYCCSHSAAAIISDPVLRPAAELRAAGHPIEVHQAHAWLADISWLTDLDWISPTIDQSTERILGLHRVSLRCVRTEYRAMIQETAEAIWWPMYRRQLTGEALDLAHQLEAEAGCRPVHWWVMRQPAPVTSLVKVINRGTFSARPRPELLVR